MHQQSRGVFLVKNPRLATPRTLLVIYNNVTGATFSDRRDEMDLWASETRWQDPSDVRHAYRQIILSRYVCKEKIDSVFSLLWIVQRRKGNKITTSIQQSSPSLVGQNTAQFRTLRPTHLFWHFWGITTWSMHTGWPRGLIWSKIWSSQMARVFVREKKRRYTGAEYEFHNFHVTLHTGRLRLPMQTITDMTRVRASHLRLPLNFHNVVWKSD